MVPLVGLWQRHHVRPGEPLERPVVLGPAARSPAHGRGVRPAAAPPDRPRVHPPDLPLRPPPPPPPPDPPPAPMRAPSQTAPRKDRPAVSVTWYQGQNKPAIWKEAGI